MWGMDGLLMLNLFAYRATNPKDMKQRLDPIGEENTPLHLLHYIYCQYKFSSPIFCWGNHGTHMKQDEQVIRDFKENKNECLLFW